MQQSVEHRVRSDSAASRIAECDRVHTAVSAGPDQQKEVVALKLTNTHLDQLPGQAFRQITQLASVDRVFFRPRGTLGCDPGHALAAPDPQNVPVEANETGQSSGTSAMACAISFSASFAQSRLTQQ